MPHAQLIDAAHDVARRIIRHSPLAVASMLTAVTRGINTSIAEGLQIESEQFARVAPTRDLREGLDAWIARRAPRYDGDWGTPACRPMDRVSGATTDECDNLAQR